MCLLCVISRWSRRIATMLPWLVIPFIIVWALSQLLPPSYRLEVTSSRLACLGVLLSSLVWYELMMPWLSFWRAHRSALQRERKLIRAQEAAKWRKEATRKCRNCLAAYKVQTPGSGRFVCTYCGHMSRRPMLEVPGASASLGPDGVPSNVSVRGGMRWYSRVPCEGSVGIRSRGSERNCCAWFGESLSGGHKCSVEQAYPYPLFFVLRVLSLMWEKVLDLKHSTTYGARSPQGIMNSEVAANEIKSEKARRKADKKKQARLLKEVLEAEDKKQREEVALLVEEQRRQRHELEVARQREDEAAGEREMMMRQEEQKEQIGKSMRKVIAPVSGKLVFQDQPENAAQVKSKAAGKVADKVIGSIAGTKGSGGTPQDHASKHKNTINTLAKITFLRNHGTRPQRASGSSMKIGPFFESNGSRRGRIDDPVAGGRMSSSRGPSPSLKTTEGPEASGSSWTKAPWICALLTGSKRPTDERSNIRLDSGGDHCKGVDQGIIDGLKLYSKSEESRRGKEDGSVVVGNSVKCSDCTSTSLKAAESRQVSTSGWKQAPWISGWVRGSTGINDESGKTQVGSGSGRGLDQVMDGGVNSFNNGSSVIKRPFSPVKGTAIHPPIAPPSTHVDPLQQLFSTPSLFSPMCLPVDLNRNQSDRNVQTDTKAFCLQGHSFFEAQKHPELVDSLTSPFTSPPGMHANGLKSSFMELDAVGMQGFMPLDASYEMHTHAVKGSFMESDRVAVQNLVPSDGSYEMAGLTIQAPLQSPPLIPLSFVGSTNVDNSDPISVKEALLQLDEEALHLPPFSTVQSLFDSETLALEKCLVSPMKVDSPYVNEDVLLDEIHCSDKRSLWADITRVLDESDSGQKVPAEFVDCITQEIMEDPVITADGHSYERSAIDKWLKNHDTSPKTGEVLPPPPGSSGVDKTLRPNHILHGQILEYKEKLTRMSGLRAMTWSMTSKDVGSVFRVTSSPSVLSF